MAQIENETWESLTIQAVENSIKDLLAHKDNDDFAIKAIGRANSCFINLDKESPAYIVELMTVSANLSLVKQYLGDDTYQSRESVKQEILERLF